MTCKINLSTSTGLELESDTSGIVDIQSNGTTKMTVGTTIDIQGNELVLDADADTSITADTDDQIDFKIGGTDRLSISSTGKVTSTQTGGANNFEIQTTSDNTLGADLTLYQNSSSPADNDITSFISFAGNDSGGTKTTYSQIRGIATDVSDTTEDGMITLLTTGGGTLTERLRITSEGQMRFGTTGELNNSQVCIESHSANPNGIEVRTDGNNNAITFYSGSTTYAGAISLSGASTSYTSASDYRLKENVSYTWDATTRLKQLRPCRFNWISDDTDTALDGFLAHEVSTVVPDAVKGAKDATKTQNVYDDNGIKTGTQTVPDYQGIDQSKLVPLLVKTIQELEARITALENN
jgi:hypothetical protein